MSSAAITVTDLAKTYFVTDLTKIGQSHKTAPDASFGERLRARLGLRRKVEAVRGVSFTVKRGEVFGFLGPNGAGKTTTIRVLMGLIKATAGSAEILGNPIPSRAARAMIGFLPEAPYFYDFLTVAELLDFTGRLFGLDRAERARRTDRLIELVGLEHARSNALKGYSKGMLQRAGIAQALINNPELIVCDEPMGGLDPVGRKEVRDIIHHLRDEGKTVFFSSHILADVESVADRVAILSRGVVHDIGTLGELVDTSIRGTEIVLRTSEMTEEARDSLLTGIDNNRQRGDELHLVLGPSTDVNDLLSRAIAAGASILDVSQTHETLEDVFIRAAADDGPRIDRSAGDEGEEE